MKQLNQYETEQVAGGIVSFPLPDPPPYPNPRLRLLKAVRAAGAATGSALRKAGSRRRPWWA